MASPKCILPLLTEKNGSPHCFVTIELLMLAGSLLVVGALVIGLLIVGSLVVGLPGFGLLIDLEVCAYDGFPVALHGWLSHCHVNGFLYGHHMDGFAVVGLGDVCFDDIVKDVGFDDVKKDVSLVYRMLVLLNFGYMF